MDLQRFKGISIHKTFVLLFTSWFFFFYLSNTHSQNSTQSKIIGRTRTVALVPWGSVNAGPFIFSVDSDHDGMPDDAEL